MSAFLPLQFEKKRLEGAYLRAVQVIPDHCDKVVSLFAVPIRVIASREAWKMSDRNPIGLALNF
jgi:hypothetical protein